MTMTTTTIAHTASAEPTATLTAGLVMACASVNRFQELDRAGRRALLDAWAAFQRTLADLGVTIPTDSADLES